MFQLRWLKRFVRRNTRKIPEDHAVKWQRRLSMLYMVFAWNAFGAIIYLCVSGRKDWLKASAMIADSDTSRARSWAQTLGVKNAKVITLSGFHVTDRYEINEDENEANNVNQEVDKVEEFSEFSQSN